MSVSSGFTVKKPWCRLQFLHQPVASIHLSQVVDGSKRAERTTFAENSSKSRSVTSRALTGLSPFFRCEPGAQEGAATAGADTSPSRPPVGGGEHADVQAGAGGRLPSSQCRTVQARVGPQLPWTEMRELSNEPPLEMFVG